MSTTLRFSPSFQAAIAASPTFELKSRRHTAAGGFEYLIRQNTTFKVNAKQSFREGDHGPFGTYLSTEIELPVPIDNKLTDVDASLEAAKGDALFRLGYTRDSGSATTRADHLRDDPARAADKTDTANTSSQGRLPALAPDSTRIGVNAMVSYKLPKRSRLTA